MTAWMCAGGWVDEWYIWLSLGLHGVPGGVWGVDHIKDDCVYLYWVGACVTVSGFERKLALDLHPEMTWIKLNDNHIAESGGGFHFGSRPSQSCWGPGSEAPASRSPSPITCVTANQSVCMRFSAGCGFPPAYRPIVLLYLCSCCNGLAWYISPGT